MQAGIASRSPEGDEVRCLACGSLFCIEPTRPPGDATCPVCGALVWVATRAERHALHVDDQVIVMFGQFVGFPGRIQSLDSEKRTARVLLTLFGRTLSTDIPWRELMRPI